MTRETNLSALPAAAPVAVATPVEAKSTKPWWVIVAVLAVLLGSFVVKRLFVRPGRS